MIGSYPTNDILLASTPPDDDIRVHLRAYRQHALARTESGVSERVVFVEKLREALEHRSPSAPGFSLLFIHIRAVILGNERHGFPTASSVSDAVAATLRRGLRAADVLIRCGKQGFVVFLARASAAGAKAATGRLAATIHDTNFIHESVAFQVNMGVTVAPVQAEDTVDTILDRADHFLLEWQSEEELLREHPLPSQVTGR
jgi:diguanylate cyclase (GGDEF)-like protein